VVRLLTRDPLRHRKVFDAMRSAGIGVNLHYMPVHLQPDFRRLGFRPGMFEEAESYGEAAMSLPMFPHLTDRDQDHVVKSLSKALESS
jgi:dTDP-4-amino-4,6-dideoxygalactose transaminase